MSGTTGQPPPGPVPTPPDPGAAADRLHAWKVAKYSAQQAIIAAVISVLVSGGITFWVTSSQATSAEEAQYKADLLSYQTALVDYKVAAQGLSASLGHLVEINKTQDADEQLDADLDKIVPVAAALQARWDAVQSKVGENQPAVARCAELLESQGLNLLSLALSRGDPVSWAEVNQVVTVVDGPQRDSPTNNAPAQIDSGVAAVGLLTEAFNTIRNDLDSDPPVDCGPLTPKS